MPSPVAVSIALLAALAGAIAPALRAAEDRLPGYENPLGMQFVLVPAGEFDRGSPPDEARRRDDERRHRVLLTRDFYIGRHETTRGQFRQFVEETGYRTEPERDGQGGYGYDAATGQLDGRDPKYDWRATGFDQTDDHPVVNVTWHDADEFCRWLSRREGRLYRLPTEAEWEYACRAGTTTPFAHGEDEEGLAGVANIVDASAHALFPDRIAIAADDGFIFTAPVGSFRPNAWGIHDMHGNVWEWTADWYAEYPDSPDPLVDPRGPAEGTDRAIHGGDWYHDASFARSASRYPIPPQLPRRHGGFRVALEP